MGDSPEVESRTVEERQDASVWTVETGAGPHETSHSELPPTQNKRRRVNDAKYYKPGTAVQFRGFQGVPSNLVWRGIFEKKIDDGYGIFLWENPTLGSYRQVCRFHDVVCLYQDHSEVSPDVLHNAMQSKHVMKSGVRKSLKLGHDKLGQRKYVLVKIPVVDAEEFTLVFEDCPANLTTRVVKKPSLADTYLGLVKVIKTHHSIVFRTFRDWASYVNELELSITRHQFRELYSIMCPSGCLANGASFTPSHPCWEILSVGGFTPLQLDRAIGNCRSVLVSSAGIDAASDAREYPVWILDIASVTPSVEAYYVFVKTGDATETTEETRQLASLPSSADSEPDDIVRLRGHFGWIPVDGILDWAKGIAGLISTTFTGVRTAESGVSLRTLSPPVLSFRPLLVSQASGEVVI